MAGQSAALKQQIEAQLYRRIPGALSPMIRPEVVLQPLADARLNELLHGGVPVGAITEVHGTNCSGRTSLALSLASSVTTSGRVAAWVDVSDALDPEIAALCNVDLERLLWVRCGGTVPETKAGRAHERGTEIAPSPTMVAPDHMHKPVGNGGCGSPHPRSEGKGMAQALDALLHNQPRSAAIKQQRSARRGIGTPGAPNLDLRQTRLLNEIVPTSGSLFGRQVPRDAMPFPNASPYREEQVPTDRQASRRAAKPSRSDRTTPRPGMHCSTAPAASKRGSVHSWTPLDQALRTVDLLLQAGGFSLLVLDLGSVPENMAWRIPLATWFRFRAGCERSRATLLVISQRPCARASADLTVAMEPGRMQSVAGAVAVGGTFHVRVEQQRRGSHIGTESNLLAFRKPPRADHDPSSNRVWTASASWKVSA